MPADPAFPASAEVDAIRRQVQAAGGFATVLRKGTPWGGSLLIVHRCGDFTGAYEKIPSLSGKPDWRLAAEGDSAVAAFAASQQKFDPDLWVLELDIASPARFVPGFPR